MSGTNGERTIGVGELSDSTKLDIILEALENLSETLETLRLQQEELGEKIVNMSLPGSNFEIFEDS